jgi:hypothetical protein
MVLTIMYQNSPELKKITFGIKIVPTFSEIIIILFLKLYIFNIKLSHNN